MNAILMTPLRKLTLTIAGEARGQGIAGMAAVGCVIRTRAAHPRWWGRDIITVCDAHEQFSCWNADDPNRALLLAAGPFDPWFPDAEFTARAIITDRQPDITNGATHYANLTECEPAWRAPGLQPTAIIGKHTFFRLEI